MPTDELVIDLGRAGSVGAVELALGRFVHDFPRDLRIEGSLDKQTWVTLWQGSTLVRALAAALADPRRLPMRLPYPASNVRYLRLRQLGSDPVYYWTVVELVVRSTAAPPATLLR